MAAEGVWIQMLCPHHELTFAQFDLETSVRKVGLTYKYIWRLGDDTCLLPQHVLLPSRPRGAETIGSRDIVLEELGFGPDRALARKLKCNYSNCSWVDSCNRTILGISELG